MYDSTSDTLNHMSLVCKLLGEVIRSLQFRQITHDSTKLDAPEKPIFDEYTPKLQQTTFGSQEYTQNLHEMQVALDHHYKFNAHHPEHFGNGIFGMTLVDLIEMICDWKAASMRHADGDIHRSIDINQKRFGYSDELKLILFNTVNEYFVDKG